MDVSRITAVFTIARRIETGTWHGLLDTSAERLGDCTLEFITAALWSRNASRAYDFINAIIDKKPILDTDETAELFAAKKRLDVVLNRNGWTAPDEVTPVKERIIEPFPVDVFPLFVEKYCDSVSRNVQVDRAMICVAVLAAAALSVQGRYMIAYPSGNGHKEHLCLYIVVVADPGERKTSVFQKALMPVRAWQREARKAYEDEMAVYKSQNKAIRCQESGITKQLEKPGLTDDKREELEKQLEDVTRQLNALDLPKNPDIIADDVTPEALAKLMKKTGETAGVFTDEPDFFKIIAGLYSSGTTANMSLILKAYDGSYYSRQRINDTEVLLRPLLSMCVFAQPVMFEQLQNNMDLQGRGMVGRLLICEPEKKAGSRNVRQSDKIDYELAEQYKELLCHFLDEPQTSDEECPVIEWEDDAAKLMLEYLQSLEDTMKDGGTMVSASDYASKAGGVALRIAGILHLLESGGTPDTDLTMYTVQRAIQIHQYFFNQKAQQVAAAETKEERMVHIIEQKLKTLTVDKLKAYTSVSSLQQAVRKTKGLETRKDIDPFLEALQDAGVIEIVQLEGSKRSLVYISPYFAYDAVSGILREST